MTSPAVVDEPDELAEAIVTMRPSDGVVDADDAWCLAGDGCYLIYTSGDEPLNLNLADGSYEAEWLDPAAVDVVATEQIRGDAVKLKPQSRVLWLTAVEKISNAFNQ